MRTWCRLPAESSDTAGEANGPGTTFGGGFGAAQPNRPMQRISARPARVLTCAEIASADDWIGWRRELPVVANFETTSEAVVMTTGYNTQTLGVKQNATSCHRLRNAVVGCTGALRGVVALFFVLTTGMLGACQTLQDIPNPLEERPTGPQVAGMFKGEPDIRVRINRGVGNAEIAGPARVIVRQVGASVGSPVTLATPLRVSSSNKGISLRDNAGNVKEFGFGNDIEVVASLPSVQSESRPSNAGAISAAQALRVNGTVYPGVVMIRPLWSTAPTAFDVIVDMGIETYLPGVLTHELFKDWPRQTYQAQSVTARTYALHERHRARGENRAFDVESTEADQVFGGLTQSSLANEAVRATRGMVLTNNGRLIRAYYSSTCGGRPASAAKCWPMLPDRQFNKDSTLQAEPREHACQKATFYRWSVTRSDDDVSRRMRAWGRRTSNKIAQIGRVREISSEELNDANRANSYIVTDDRNATYILTSEELRESCNEPIADAPPITRDTRVHSSDVNVRIWANQVEFSGKGWGHAVGMCQWCAKGFADLGWDWRKMMETFYPGVTVTKAYE